MLFNNARCTALTPEYVNAASGLDLHQFRWLTSDEEIGALPKRWNHLVGYDAPTADAALVHYTLGRRRISRSTRAANTLKNGAPRKRECSLFGRTELDATRHFVTPIALLTLRACSFS